MKEIDFGKLTGIMQDAAMGLNVALYLLKKDDVCKEVEEMTEAYIDKLDAYMESQAPKLTTIEINARRGCIRY